MNQLLKDALALITDLADCSDTNCNCEGNDRAKEVARRLMVSIDWEAMPTCKGGKAPKVKS